MSRAQPRRSKNEFQRTLYELERARGMLPSHVAKAAGISLVYYMEIWSKDRIPSDAVVLKIARALDYPERKLILLAHREKAPREVRYIFDTPERPGALFRPLLHCSEHGPSVAFSQWRRAYFCLTCREFLDAASIDGLIHNCAVAWLAGRYESGEPTLRERFESAEALAAEVDRLLADPGRREEAARLLGRYISRVNISSRGVELVSREEAARRPPPPAPTFEPTVEESIPLISLADAGRGTEWTDGGLPVGGAFDYLPRPKGLTDPNAYAVEIRGDSMFPRFKDGERVLVSPQAEARPGNDVIVRLTSGEVVCKTLQLSRDRQLLLTSANPTHEDLLLARQDVAFLHRIVANLM